MDFEQENSGLLIPKQKPEEPKRKYGLMEIRDEARREMAKKALDELWKAMSLHDHHYIHAPDMPLPSEDLCKIYNQVFNFVGKMLLGKDCPEHEVKT